MFANHSANNRPPRWLGILTALLLLGVAGVLRFYRLEEAPPGLYPDIAANGVDALQVLRGHLQVFFPENNGREGMIIYLVAGMIHFMGRTVLALLLPSAVASVLTVLAVFLLCQTLYQTVEWDDTLGRTVAHPVWQGWIAGIIAAGLLAVSLGPIIIGRGGWRANLFPLFLALAIATLWNGFQRRSWLWIGLAGLCSGLVAYTYLASRVYPLLLLLFALSFVPDILRKKLKVPIPLLLGYVGISFVVALPMLLYFVANPGQLAARSSELLVVKADQSLLVNLRALSQNLLDHLAVFGWSGDPNPRHAYQQMPWLSPLEAILFWLGVGWLCWHWRKPVSRLLLLWLAVMLLPAVLAIDTPPNTLRMVGLLPAVYITIGTSVAHLVTLLHRFASKSFPNGQAFAIRETRAFGYLGFGTGILVAIWIVAQGYSSYHIYFDKWLPDPATYEAYLGEWKAMIEEVNPKSVDSGEVYLVPTGSQFPRDYHIYQFDYLYTGSLPVHLFKMGESDAAEEVYQALVQDQLQQSVRRVNVVNWTRGEHWSGDGTNRLLFLFNKYAQPESPARYTNYDVYPFQRIELGKPWQLYEQLEPLKVEYDGHISLLGVAFGLHGGEQKLREQPVRLTSELLQQPPWLVLMWRADQRMTSDYRVSLRLHDATGALVFQQDQDLRNYDRLTTSGWGAQAIVESLHTLAVPSDLPKGAYQLRVVLYDNVTLTPTVQIGVWQPEYRLAELIIE